MTSNEDDEGIKETNFRYLFHDVGISNDNSNGKTRQETRKDNEKPRQETKDDQRKNVRKKQKKTNEKMRKETKKDNERQKKDERKKPTKDKNFPHWGLRRRTHPIQ
jgi:hypothetical protein